MEDPVEETPKKPATAGGVRATGKNVRHLRALGHVLEPVVQIGKRGLTDTLVAETRQALARHELIKVKVQGEAPLDRKEAAEELAAATGALLAQVLGRTFLLFQRHPKKPKIELPDDKKKKAKVVPEGRNPGPSKGRRKPTRRARPADEG